MVVVPVYPELVPCEFRVTFEVVEDLDGSRICSLALHLSSVRLVRQFSAFVASDVISHKAQAGKLFIICETAKDISGFCSRLFLSAELDYKCL